MDDFGGYAAGLRRSSRWVIGLYAVATLLLMAAVGLDLTATVMHPQTWNDPYAPVSESEAQIAAAMVGVSLLGLGVWVLALIVFLRFFHRITKTTHEFAAEIVETSPGWAVGWWFVPIANLWKPYGVIKRLFTANDPATLAGERGIPPVALIGWYWAVWIISSVLSQATFRMTQSPDPSVVETAVYIDVATSVLDVVALVLLYKWVTLLRDWHLAKITRSDYAEDAAPEGELPTLEY
ncbi:MAG: DUF4328 domain-containing protein [Planctomycetota bacterium]